jgi:type IX secretion system PorP/SprF family membrane protein
MNSMPRKLFLIFLTLFVFTKFSSAQDPHFSQFYANSLYLNPALAGSVVCPRLNLNYRNQWPSILGTFITYSASYDQHVDVLNGGVGLLVYSDRQGAGTLNTTSVSGMYSYRLEVSRNFSLKAGLQATYFQRSLDWEKLTFPDQLDPRYGFVYNSNEPIPDNLSRTFADFAAGLVGYTERFYVGFAAHHITRPDEGFNSYTRMPIRYTGHLGTVIGLEGMRGRKKGIEETSISPNLMYMRQQDFEQLNYGLYFSKYPFVGGLWFRQNFNNPDALIMLIGIQQAAFKVGYSYDLTVSSLTNASGGSHELSLTFQFECLDRQPRAKPINCPTF